VVLVEGEGFGLLDVPGDVIDFALPGFGIIA
jgi:hypothetical protein